MDYTLPSFDQIDIKVDVRVLVSIPQHTSSSNFYSNLMYTSRTLGRLAYTKHQ